MKVVQQKQERSLTVLSLSERAREALRLNPYMNYKQAYFVIVGIIMITDFKSNIYLSPNQAWPNIFLAIADVILNSKCRHDSIFMISVYSD